jgi:hypothetical protein
VRRESDLQANSWIAFFTKGVMIKLSQIAGDRFLCAMAKPVEVETSFDEFQRRRVAP